MASGTVSNTKYDVIKLLSFLSFVSGNLVFILLLLAPPARKYEYSVYKSYSDIIWILVYCAIMLGLTSLILSSQGRAKSNHRILGLMGAGIGTFSVLLIPLIRGYAAYGRGDVLTHLGTVGFILENGHLPSDFFYPILHLLAAGIVSCTGISSTEVSMIVPAVFFMLYVCFTFLLARTLLSSGMAALLVLSIAMIPLLRVENTMFAPSVQAFQSIPFILYVYVRRCFWSPRNGHSIIWVLSIAFIVPFHPETALLVLLILIVLNFTYFNRIPLHTSESPTENKKEVSWRGVALLSLLFAGWYLPFSRFGGFVRVFVSLLFRNPETTVFETYSGLTATVHPSIGYLIWMGTNAFGITIALSVAGLLATITLFRRAHEWMEQLPFLREPFRFLTTSFVLFLGISLALTFYNNLLVGPMRVVRYFTLFASIVIGATYFVTKSLTHKKENRPNWRLIPFLALLMLLLYCSLVSLFPSPYLTTPNAQITEMDIQGMHFLFTNWNQELQVKGFEVAPYRFYELVESNLTLPQNLRATANATTLPEHFGYDKNESLGASFNQDTYLAISSVGRGWYQNISPQFPERWKWTQNDFAHLEEDSSVSRFLDTGDLQIYYVAAP